MSAGDAKKSAENGTIKKLKTLLNTWGNKAQQASHFQYPFSYPYYAPPPPPPPAQLTHGPHVTESEEDD